MGDAKDKKKDKTTAKHNEDMDFLLQLNVVEDLEEVENELEDTYREF